MGTKFVSSDKSVAYITVLKSHKNIELECASAPGVAPSTTSEASRAVDLVYYAEAPIGTWLFGGSVQIDHPDGCKNSLIPFDSILPLSFRKRIVGWGMPIKEGLGESVGKPKKPVSQGRCRDFGDMYVVILPLGLSRTAWGELKNMVKMAGGAFMMLLFLQNPSLFFVIYMILQMTGRAM